MTETRRQIFKTSILSAVGFAAAAGIAGCTISTGVLNPLKTGPSSGDATIVGVDGNTWYVFVYQGTDPTGGPLYTVFSTGTAYGSVYPSQFPFDTSFFKNSTPTVGSGFQQLTNTSFSLGGNQYTVGDKYLSNPATLLGNTNNRSLSQAYWNEVGKQ